MAVEFKKTGFVRNLAKRHKLVQHLDKAIAGKEFPFEFKMEPKGSDDAWHPSGHCTLSPSELYDIAQGAKSDPPSGSLLKSFAVGHFWHQYLQHIVEYKLGFCNHQAIERRGHRWWGDPVPPADVEDWPLNEHGGDMHKRMYRKEDLYYQRYPEQKDGRVTDAMIRSWPDDEHGMCKVRPAPYHWATGSGDVAPCEIPNHGPYVVDFKTMSSQQYKQPNLPDWAAAKYECQINVYMDFFDLEKGLIVGICKDSPHEFKEFEFVRNQDLIDAIYDKWEFVSELLDAGEAPTALDDEAFDNLPITGPAA